MFSLCCWFCIACLYIIFLCAHSYSRHIFIWVGMDGLFIRGNIENQTVDASYIDGLYTKCKSLQLHLYTQNGNFWHVISKLFLTRFWFSLEHGCFNCAFRLPAHHRNIWQWYIFGILRRNAVFTRKHQRNSCQAICAVLVCRGFFDTQSKSTDNTHFMQAESWSCEQTFTNCRVCILSSHLQIPLLRAVYTYPDSLCIA